MELRTIEWKDDSVVMIDQTKLPNELVFVKYTDYNDVADAIRTLVVRGAPAIGVSGAFGMALAALQSSSETKENLLSDLEKAKKILNDTRPTAVNLSWGLKTIMQIAKQGKTVSEIKDGVIAKAKHMAEEDILKVLEDLGHNTSLDLNEEFKELHVGQYILNDDLQESNKGTIVHLDSIEPVAHFAGVPIYKTQENIYLSVNNIL